jgi:hypothetical protein
VYTRGSGSWEEHERERKLKMELKLLVTRLYEFVDTVDGVGSLRSGLQVRHCDPLLV